MTGEAMGQGSEFNLTTIEPDNETIDTLIDAVDTAVTSLQNAAGGTTDSSFPSFENFDYSSWEVRLAHCLPYKQNSWFDSLKQHTFSFQDYGEEQPEDVITGSGNGDFDYNFEDYPFDYGDTGGGEQDPDDLENLPGAGQASGGADSSL